MNTGETFEPIYKTIGKRLRWLREQKGWTIAQLAAAIRISAPSVGAWETGKIKVKVHDLVNIAHAYGASVEDFFSLLLSGLDPAEARTPAVVQKMRARAGVKRMLTMEKNGTSTSGKKKREKKT